MPDPAAALLLGRLRAGALAPFYVVRHPSRAALRDWARGLLEGFLREWGREPRPEAHPADVVVLPKDDGEPWALDDKVNVLGEFARFGRNPPMDLPWKLLVLESPRLLPEAFSNKLLKGLEEPPPRSTVLFLHDGGGPLLPTVESRAVRLRLPAEGPPPPPGEALPRELARAVGRFLDGGGGLDDLLEAAKGADQAALASLVLERHLAGARDGAAHQRAILALRRFEESLAHRNAPGGRLAPLLRAAAPRPRPS